MSEKLLAFFLTILVVGDLISFAADGAWLDSTELNQTNAIVGHTIQSSAGVPIISQVVDWAQKFWKVISFDFVFFPGSFQIIRWILLMIFGGMAAYAVAREFRGTITSIFGRRG